MAIRPPERDDGFTLIEILVAMVIFLLSAAIAYTGFDQFNKHRQTVQQNLERLHDVQFAVRMLAQDLYQLQPRPVRDPLGDTPLPALLADGRREYIIEYTHAGWPNPLGLPRGTLQRVGYRLEEDKLIREYWVVLDRTLANEPVSSALLDQVTLFEVRYLDHGRNWHEQWPPTNMDPLTGQRARPVAIEFSLELEDWGRIVRLIEIPG